MKSWLIRSGLASLGIGAASWAFGVPLPRAVLIAVCVFAVVASARYWPVGWHGSWPPAPQRSFGGGSRQVSILASRIDLRRQRRRQPDAVLQQRLRRLATAKLNRAGVPDEEASEVLGPDVYKWLHANVFDPDFDQIRRIVDAIEKIDTANTHGRVP